MELKMFNHTLNFVHVHTFHRNRAINEISIDKNDTRYGMENGRRETKPHRGKMKLGIVWKEFTKPDAKTISEIYTHTHLRSEIKLKEKKINYEICLHSA